MFEEYLVVILDDIQSSKKAKTASSDVMYAKKNSTACVISDHGNVLICEGVKVRLSTSNIKEYKKTGMRFSVEKSKTRKLC